MPVTITSRPDKEIATNFDSRWLAINGGYPVLFTFYRKDYNIAQIAQDSVGFSEITIITSTGNITSQLAVGQSIYFSSASMGEITATITGFTFNGVNTVINTDHLFTAGSTDSDSANYINLLGSRSDYRLYIQVYGKANNELLSSNAYTPQPSGKIEYDVSGAITPHVNLDLDTTFPALNQANTNTTEPFYIKYAEYYGGNLLGYVADSKLYRGVNAANQILDSYDVNMGDRVAFNADITPKAKWLTSFEKPRYWPGYPFKMSVIFEPQGTQPGVARHEERFDEHGVSAGTGNTSFAASNNWDYVQEIGLAGSYATTDCEVDLWLESDGLGDPCTSYAVLASGVKWLLQTWIMSGNDVVGIYVIPNPLSGASAITAWPNGVIKDSTGSTIATIQWNATLGYYEPTTTTTLTPGAFYQAEIDPGLTVTVWASSCTGIFRQAFTHQSGIVGNGGYEDEAYTTGYN